MIQRWRRVKVIGFVLIAIWFLNLRLSSPFLYGQVTPAGSQRVTGVEMIPSTLPALVGTRSSALLKIKITTTGSINPISMTEVTGRLTASTEIGLIKSLHLHSTESTSEFRSDSRVEEPTQPTSTFQLRSNHPLREGDNFVWIACTLHAEADIDQTIGVVCQSVSFSDGSTHPMASDISTQRLGIAVRNGGDDDVHTYRIPGLATTKAGSLIAVYDVRYRGGGDLPGDIDVGMSRSIDGGRSWQPMKIIMDMGDDPRFRYDGIGDPCILVDDQTGTIWCAGVWSHGDRGWSGSGPGLSPDETGQLMLVKSDDDAVTWSQPINITEQVKRPEWCFLLQGPGKGITMSDGTLVFPAQYQDAENPNDRRANRLPHSTIIFSRDHGVTWQSGTGAYDDTTEAQVVELGVELGVGRLMLNCRYNRESKRVVMTSADLGKTWQPHSTNRSALIEPKACMASLIRAGENPDTLLFSNPNSLSGRNHMTIQMSLDDGITWPQSHQLLIDEQGSAGYSCMTMIDQDTIGILYEGSQSQMTFQRIELQDLYDP